MTSSSIQMYMHCAVKCVQLRPSNWDLWPRTGSTDFPVRTLEDRFTLQKKNGIGRFQSNYIFFDNTAYSPFSHINERVNVCLCKIDLSPSFHLTACCDPSLASFDLTRTDHSCQLPREPLPVTVPYLGGLRSSWRCVTCWGSSINTVAAPQCCGTPLPHISLSWGQDVMEVSAADEMCRIQ